MKLLTPLGLLGLLGIAVLILIYVIKPNYQQKTVSSTFVWKLSLKYKKKRVQINKLRNVLLILCQVLVLTACALILAEPNRVVKAETDPSEVIAIIDSSASMRAQKDGESRFERAVKKSLSLSEEVFSNGGLFSVILADENPSFLLNRISAAEEDKVSAALEELLEEDACTYGASNMDAAIKLSENILNENPKAQIYLYTDTTYSYVPSTVNLVSVSETGGMECRNFERPRGNGRQLLRFLCGSRLLRAGYRREIDRERQRTEYIEQYGKRQTDRI